MNLRSYSLDYIMDSKMADSKKDVSIQFDTILNALNTSDSDYTIEISIDEMKTEGPYVSSGFFYFALYVYGYSHSVVAGPAISNLKVSYHLNGYIIQQEDSTTNHQTTLLTIHQ